MKRIGLLTLTIILIMLTLTSCIVIPIYKRFKIDADTVTSIEIYDLCELDSLYGNFDKTQKNIYKISADKNADFLNDLAEIRFSDSIILVPAAVDPSFYYDEWTVRINYTDGSYEFISSDGYGQKFNKDDQEIDSHHFGCKQEEWLEFIKKYIPAEIFNHSHTEK